MAKNNMARKNQGEVKHKEHGLTSIEGGRTEKREMKETGLKQHNHQRIEVRTWCPDCNEELGHQTFNRADIEKQQVTQLPAREAMSLVNANVAAPINAALALNVLSDGSIAIANATQYAPITQST